MHACEAADNAVGWGLSTWKYFLTPTQALTVPHVSHSFLEPHISTDSIHSFTHPTIHMYPTPSSILTFSLTLSIHPLSIPHSVLPNSNIQEIDTTGLDLGPNSPYITAR